MLLDTMIQEDVEIANESNYAKLKEKAQDREACRQWNRTCPWTEHSMNEVSFNP